jgi:lysozyme
MPPVASFDLPPELLLANLSPPSAIVQTLQRDEGLRLKLFRDPRGNWLIGYGRNLKSRGISGDEAMLLLQNDILACQGDLDKHLAWWRQLSDLRQMAMLSLCYNLGIYGLTEFKGALKSMQRGNFKEAARQFMASQWARQVGQRARRITHIIEHDTQPPNSKEMKKR